MQFRPCFLLTVQDLNYQTVVCYLINWKFVMCFSVFFSPHSSCFLLWSTSVWVFPPRVWILVWTKRPKELVDWYSFLSRVYSCSFPLWTLFTFKLFILRSFTHTWQYFEEWKKYRIRKLFSVKCHGEMVCYLVYLFPVWICNTIFCLWGELSFPFLASANLNCCKTVTWSLSWLAPKKSVAGATGMSWAEYLPAWPECLWNKNYRWWDLS